MEFRRLQGSRFGVHLRMRGSIGAAAVSSPNATLPDHQQPQRNRTILAMEASRIVVAPLHYIDTSGSDLIYPNDQTLPGSSRVRASSSWEFAVVPGGWTLNASAEIE